jgi:propanol-preferring alcohol dehydrogenase
MIFETPRQPLALRDMPVPQPDAGQVLIRVSACGVCRTDLHVVDGELPDPKPPLIPGHEIVGHIVQCGKGVTGFRSGDRVGVPWLAWTCGECDFCRSGRENLCDRARFTGYTIVT